MAKGNFILNSFEKAWENKYEENLQYITKRLSAIHLLNTECQSLFDEICMKLDDSNLLVRNVKMHTNDVIKVYDRYIGAMNQLINVEQKSNLAYDYENFEKLFKNFANIDEGADRKFLIARKDGKGKYITSYFSTEHKDVGDDCDVFEVTGKENFLEALRQLNKKA